jgi:hypothetical protein
MNFKQAIERIKRAIEGAPRNDYIAEFHIQVIKYAEMLENATGREFCEAMDLNPSFGTEFAKMRKIAGRLRKAGMDPAKL